jgi:Tfp pilus assembly protein PilP
MALFQNERTTWSQLRLVARATLLTPALIVAACASNPDGLERYAADARRNFIEACIHELQDLSPRRATVYLPLNGHMLTVPEYCIQMARLRTP